jgi:Domain of unknown function (DUF6894)
MSQIDHFCKARALTVDCFHTETNMNRFFFHIESRDDCIFDTNGREFGDLATAHRHAMGLIQKMILLDDSDWRGWSINVTDASNQSVLSVLFPQVPYLPMSQGVAIQRPLTTAGS